ncbi:WXG100 family type VII secretion target [Streptomyces sp. NPDC003042]
MATNFEGYTHEQLLAMIASLNPETVKARGTQLTQAADTIKEIGRNLKKHQVKGWEGEAAQAFQDWVSRAGSATLLLGDYSAAGGKWMTEAAQTMVEVKANTPKYDTGAAANLAAAREYRNDPDSQEMGQTAHSKLSGDRQQAIQQLTKLAQSYDASATQMGKAEVPTFPPPPGDFEPKGVFAGSYMDRSSGGSGGESGSGASSYAVSVPEGGARSNEPGRTAVQPAAPDNTRPPTAEPLPTLPPLVMPDRDVNVDLDHVATLPDKTLPPTTGLPGGPGPGTPVGPGVPGPFPSGPMPSLTLPSKGGPSLPGGGPLPPGTRPPSGLGGKVGLPPRDTGIMGGRPITSGPTAGIPRGTVIGGEGTHAGGRGPGGMMGGGLGGPHGGQGGSAAGRRLAMEQGGVVGGRQAAAGGRPVAGGQPFTQGGSGLVRNGAGSGGMGHAGTGAQNPGTRRNDRGGERPDYLAEDEETWQGNRRVVPPVID